MKEKILVSIKLMSDIIIEMIELVYKGLMDNDCHYLDKVLDKEITLDDLEKDIVSVVTDISKDNEKDKADFILYAQIAQNLERIGDEIRSLVERIEIKIVDRLFFSDVGVEQYKEVFGKMTTSVNLTVQLLKEGKKDLINTILKNGDGIKVLIEKYRKEHLKRLAEGICKARASNMYFDMLDFTGNIARHCTNIAKIIKEN